MMFVGVNFDALATGSDIESKVDQLSSSAEFRIRTPRLWTESSADWMPADKPSALSRIKLKAWDH